MNTQPHTRTKVVILGGGQLALMLLEPIRRNGGISVVFCQSPKEPAAQVTNEVIVGDWNNPTAAREIIESGAEHVFCEFENAPASLVEQIGEHVQVHSLPKLLGTAQSRIAEKELGKKLGIDTAHFTSFQTDDNGKPNASFKLEGWGPKLVAKPDKESYDGKGQVFFESHEDFFAHDFKPNTAYELEQVVEIAYECSVITVGTHDGTILTSPAIRNVHTNRYGGGILHYSFWHPGAVPKHTEQAVQTDARTIAKHFGLIGINVPEFMVDTTDKKYWNETAPRPHNSGHGTIEAANVSQFEQYVAAVLGLAVHPMSLQPFVSFNLIGKHIKQLRRFQEAGWSGHDYGKASIGHGRKMGHVTKVCRGRSEVEEAIKFGLELTA